ncbi:hypothetical protein ABT144_29115 [Streptomyces sp. NPDC002039]
MRILQAAAVLSLAVVAPLFAAGAAAAAPIGSVLPVTTQNNMGWQ